MNKRKINYIKHVIQYNFLLSVSMVRYYDYSTEIVGLFSSTNL